MAFIRAGVRQPSAWNSLRGQIYLGSEAFVNRMQTLFNDRSAMTEIPHTQRRPLAKSLEYYRDTMADAKTAMITAYTTGDYTMQEIAMFFGVHYATVSRAVKKYGTAMHDCKT
jgi:putative transposase